MSEYQYYEFLAIDRPLTDDEQAVVGEFSSRATITATSFVDEYHGDDFKGDPHHLMRDYYDAHLYLANWGTHQIMLRMPRAVLDPEVARQYSVDDQVSVSVTDEHLIIELTSEDDEAEDWEEDTEASLAAIAGTRAELAAGDLRPLYLAWLSAYGSWERDEEAFEDEDEDVTEPPVPAGLGSLTDAQRALADFLRLDHDLLAVAAEASVPLNEAAENEVAENQAEGETAEEQQALSAHVAGLPSSEKDRLLLLVARQQGALARTELLRGFRGPLPVELDPRPRRTVAELLDAAAEHRQ